MVYCTCSLSVLKDVWCVFALRKPFKQNSKKPKNTEFWRQQKTSKANVYNENSSKKHPFFFFPWNINVDCDGYATFWCGSLNLGKQNYTHLVWLTPQKKMIFFLIPSAIHKEVFNFIFQPWLTGCAHIPENVTCLVMYCDFPFPFFCAQAEKRLQFQRRWEAKDEKNTCQW